MPEFASNYCAYHTNQHLTNFCTCAQCLLPVCPTCIKVHIQEHQRKGTKPDFQKLSTVFYQVYGSCNNIYQGLQRLKEELLEVEKVKKENETLILQKIKLYRNKLIREFERVLMEVEHHIVKKFQEQDEKLIAEIQQIDRTIARMEQDVLAQMVSLEGEDGLRRMIFNLSQNYQIKCLKSLTGLNQKIKDLLKKNVYLQVEEDKIEDIKESVLSYLKLGTMQWGISQTKRQSFQPNSNFKTLNNSLTILNQEQSIESKKSSLIINPIEETNFTRKNLNYYS